MSANLMMFADNSRGKPYAKDPAVVRAGGRYLMYYSIPPREGDREAEGWGIAVAESDDLTAWRALGDLPRWSAVESKGFCAPGAVALGGVVHLFYQTYGHGKDDAICHAYGADGLTFTPNPDNPVFRPVGDWTCGRAIDADVIVWQGELWLYAATRDPKMEIQKLVVASAPLDSGFGKNAWRQRLDGSPLEPELPWERKCIEAPALCRRGDRLYMFYGGGYNNEPQQIGCATSTDGIRWQRVSDEPVLPNGEAGSWNHSESGHPFVFTDADGTMHLFFQGNNDHGKSWYLSRKTIHWNGDIPCFHDVV